MKRNQIIAVLLAACFIITGWTGAVARAEEIPSLHPKAAEKKLLNGDTVGWLAVPGTTIDDVIVHYPDDFNEYYFRRDFEKKYSITGCYFADFRCRFGSQGLSRNIVIYGSSFPDSTEMFGQLNAFRDSAFAGEHPVLYFATTGETMVWEIFAVSVVDTSLAYNTPDPEDADFLDYIAKVREKSLHPYEGVTVTAADQIITLSAADYTVTSVYPNNNRLVVMAKRTKQPATAAGTQPAAESQPATESQSAAESQPAPQDAPPSGEQPEARETASAFPSDSSRFNPNTGL